ncbi:MAG TPA: flagellar assembly peptidoglycan hydrolase FlgJ, partial [Chromatiales bacterium]|nr:flagellar assembly peptidoglycan hydrolase FlgJ [Chromatiales bacterium]
MSGGVHVNGMIGSAAGEASFFLDFQGLNKLRADARHDSPKAVRAAARQFEALFLQMMLKSMRKATVGFQSGLFNNDQTRFYQGLADQQLALSMSRDAGLGLAKLLVDQLGGHRAGKSPAPGRAGGAIPLNPAAKAFPLRHRGGIPLRRPAGTATVPLSVAPGAVTHRPAADAASASDPVGFVRTIWPLARAAGVALGVGPAVLVAQAALETGWGRALVRHLDGRSTYNL